MKRIVLVCLILVLVFFVSPFLMTFADSGWDSGYGGGYSDWGGSSSYDWGGSSSYDWDDHDYGGSSYSSSPMSADDYFQATITFLIFIMFCVGIYYGYMLFLYSKIRAYNMLEVHPIDSVINKKYYIENNMFTHQEKDSYVRSQIEKLFPEYTEMQLLDYLFLNFVKVQIAWMDFDYEALEKLTTDELFSSYKADLEVLKLKNGRNIMRNFILKSIYIDSIEEFDDYIAVNAVLRVAFYDYVIDSKTNRIQRGHFNKLLNNSYKLEYKKSKKIIEKCPNCGAELHGKDCEYCHAHIEVGNKDLVLDKKILG